jgi:lipopolysaccharide/colanic/teichoic acid biosynthesis glycosyltransferase
MEARMSSDLTTPLQETSHEQGVTGTVGKSSTIQHLSYPSTPAFGGRLAAGCLLVGTAPVMALIALLVRLTSRGPVIYRQVRLGLNGREFGMYKFRTMIADAEAETGPVWATDDDPRVTFVGRVLRVCNLDELPQLVNVLNGEMALVGPRPERPEIAAALEAEVPGYFDRLVVRPGMTGLAQVNLPADTDVDSVRKKLQLDLEYIDQANLWLDARIVLSTIPRLVGSKGMWLVRLLGVRRQPVMSPDEAPPPPARIADTSEGDVSADTTNDGERKAGRDPVQVRPR